MRLCIVLVLSWSAVSVVPVSAQSPKGPELGLLPTPTPTKEAIRFEQISLREGLSQSSVYDILQDRQGFVWFATQEGLNRYDGREFKVYKHIPFDSTSFNHNWIWNLAEGPDGTIWAATNGGGVNRFDPETGKVTHYAHDPSDSSSLSNPVAFRIFVDSGGIVWVGTFGGLNRIDPETGKVTHYLNKPDDPHSLSNGLVISMYEDSRGRMWIGTGNGLNRLNAGDGKFARYFFKEEVVNSPDRIGDQSVNGIREDPADPNVLWLATGSGFVNFNVTTGAWESFVPEHSDEDFIDMEVDPNAPHVLWATTDGGGLVRFDTRFRSYTVFRHDPMDPTSVNHDALFGIHADRSGMMWVGAQSQTGVSKFNPSAGGFINYRHRAGDAASLPIGNVWGVYIAPSEPSVIWTVHQDDPQRQKDRLSRIDQVTGRVEVFAHDPRNKGSIGEGVIRDIHEDRLGQLWFATSRGGLNVFDRKTRTFKRFTHLATDSRSISGDNLSGIYEDREGILWIGTFGGGLNRLDPRRPGEFRRFPHVPADSTTLSSPFVTLEGLADDGSGHLWIGTNNGLNRLETSTGRITRYVYNADDPTSLAGNNVRKVYVDLTGGVWAITQMPAGMVLQRYDPASDSFIRYAHDPANPNSLSDFRIEVVHERPEEPGILWIGSPAGGLSRFDAATGTFKHYTEADGLANNFVYGILSDDDGNLWLSTNNGLSRFDPETEMFRNFDEDDGLQSREFNSSAFFRSPTGQMVFGSVGGVTAFDPTEMRANPVPPDVLLTDFRLFNQSVVPGEDGILEEPLSRTRQIRLAHWQRTMSFDFVALHFKNPEGNQYAYMLEGFDSDWVTAGSQRSATYTNLDPGEYLFRVKAANSDGIWNEEGASVALLIAPPFWQTWWFRIFAALAIIGLALMAYRARIRQIQSRNRELESQVGERTTELRHKNELLEKSQAIIEAINAETGLQPLLDAVLEQTKVIPGVEKASALIFDESAGAFVFKASLGWDLLQLGPIEVTADEAHARYVEHAEEIAEDIFLERNVADRPGNELLKGLETPASLLVMRISSGDQVEGYLVFDNMHRRDAFDRQDLELLISLKEHIRSAFVKTRLLENLRRSLDHLKTTQAQLVQLEKLASLGQLTAGIAHEIKNPLNFINNFAALCAELADEVEDEIRSRGAADENIEAILSDLRMNAVKIQEHGRRADGIVKSMLEHSRGKSGERRETDLNTLLDEYVSLAYHGMRAQETQFNCRIERSFDGSIGHLDLVPQDLGRVFINILNNAFYAVYEKSKTNGEVYEPAVAVSTVRFNGSVEIRINDNGPGVPETLRKKIFEPFYTTKPTGSGTGLGLSLSYDIVTQVHGGEMYVESIEGEQTTFVINIPVGAENGQFAIEN